MTSVEHRNVIACECVHDCESDPATRCYLSGDWHVHPDEPCPVHPHAPGDQRPVQS
jgi:hypothetical protein